MFAGSIQIISIVVLRCISNFQPIAIKLPAICINRYILGCVLPLLLIPLYCIGRSQDDLTPVCNRICGRTNGSIIIFVIDALPIQLNRKQTRKNLVSIGALGASGFPIFVATAFATIAIFLATGAVQESNPGV